VLRDTSEAMASKREDKMNERITALEDDNFAERATVEELKTDLNEASSSSLGGESEQKLFTQELYDATDQIDELTSVKSEMNTNHRAPKSSSSVQAASLEVTKSAQNIGSQLDYPLILHPPTPSSDLFVPLGNNCPLISMEGTEQLLSITNIYILREAASDFVWARGLDVVYMIRKSSIIRKDGVLRPFKKSKKKLAKLGRIEVCLKASSGKSFYIGTYVVDSAEMLDHIAFTQLPGQVQQVLLNSTTKGRDEELSRARDMYVSGQIKALKIPLRRIGYSTMCLNLLNTPMWSTLKYEVSVSKKHQDVDDRCSCSTCTRASKAFDHSALVSTV